MARKDSSLTTISVVKLVNELEELRAQIGAPVCTKEKEVEARINKICAELFPDAPQGEYFRALFAKRYRSSGDWMEYDLAINGLLAQVAEVAARNQHERLKGYNNKKVGKNDFRDKQIAKELFQRRGSSYQKDSQLIEEIGEKHAQTSKTALRRRFPPAILRSMAKRSRRRTASSRSWL
jgi:hypothetical protein